MVINMWIRLTSVFQTLMMMRLLVAAAIGVAVTSAAGSTVGFDSAFTNVAAPFAVSECDTVCASPGSVTLALTLTRIGDLSASATVTVSTRTPTTAVGVITATPLIDYTPLSKVPVAFAPNEKMKVVSVAIISDGTYEEDERFEAVLENPSAGVTLDTGSAVAYISIQDGGDGMRLVAFHMAVVVSPKHRPLADSALSHSHIQLGSLHSARAATSSLRTLASSGSSSFERAAPAAPSQYTVA